MLGTQKSNGKCLDSRLTLHKRLLNLRSRFHIPDSDIVLSFLKIEAEDIESVDGRMCLLDALRLICHPATVEDWHKPFIPRSEIDHRHAYYDLVNQDEEPLMSWENACIATKGVLMVEERYENPYKEQVFVVFRLPLAEVVGKGRILSQAPRGLEERALTEAEVDTERQEILRLDKLGWPEMSDTCSVSLDASPVGTS